MIDVNLILDPPNTGNNLIQFSSNTVSYLNTLPSIVNTWQVQDIIDDDTTGYHSNPVGDIITTVKTTQTTISSVCSPVPQLTGISAVAVTSANTSNNFFNHTQRLSGVVTVAEDLRPDLPHYENAVQIGKTVIYILNKKEDVTGTSVENNGPIIGNFTSLFVANDLIQFSNTCNSDLQKINNSISSTIDIDTGIITYSSNLSPTQISTITANLVYMTTFMDGMRANDENFFANEKKLIDNYNNVKLYSNPGQSELYLIENFIGSDKLKTRLDL